MLSVIKYIVNVAWKGKHIFLLPNIKRLSASFKILLDIQYTVTVDVKVFTWKTVSNAMGKVLKFVGGVPSSKLNCPPNSCMPSRAKIRMNRKRRNSRDMMDLIEFRRDITRFRSDDQYFVTWNEG